MNLFKFLHETFLTNEALVQGIGVVMGLIFNESFLNAVEKPF